MEKSKFVKVFLFVSGIILIGIGGGLLFAPIAFEASAGINLGNNISLLSEIRAPGGALFMSGILIVLGVFIPKLTFTSAILSSLIYISYGLSRILSMMIDGTPHESIVAATVIEIVIGVLGLFILVKFNRR